MTRGDLQPNEYHEYYSNYLNLVNNNTELIAGYEKDKQLVLDLLDNIPDDKMTFRYQPEKWSISELIQHLIDSERVFMYRCFRISRNDKTKLAGFEQDDYIVPSKADLKSKADLINEFTVNRENSIVLLKSLSDTDLQCLGNANGSDASARSIAFTVLGHNTWHINIIKERYL